MSGKKNILHKTLLDPQKTLLPPQHIKLDLMNIFVKAWMVNVRNICLKNFLIYLSEAKMKKKKRWSIPTLSKEKETKFPGNVKDLNYNLIVAHMKAKF